MPTPAEIKRMGETVDSLHGWAETFRFRTVDDIALPRRIEKYDWYIYGTKTLPLVAVLEKVGLVTGGSFDGEVGKAPGASIRGLSVSRWLQREIRKELKPFNSTSPIKWAVGREGLHPRRSPRDIYELEMQQASANVLAQFLFDKYVKGKSLRDQTRVFPVFPPLDH